LIWLLTSKGLPTETAVIASLVVRLATLWLAVLIGVVVFLAARRAFFNNTPNEPTPSPRGE
jgi:uncharacterized membrane protein YbhN (UPF0104 family)